MYMVRACNCCLVLGRMQPPSCKCTHLGCFQLPATTNSAATDILVQPPCGQEYEIFWVNAQKYIHIYILFGWFWESPISLLCSFNLLGSPSFSYWFAEIICTFHQSIPVAGILLISQLLTWSMVPFLKHNFLILT